MNGQERVERAIKQLASYGIAVGAAESAAGFTRGLDAGALRSSAHLLFRTPPPVAHADPKDLEASGGARLAEAAVAQQGFEEALAGVAEAGRGAAEVIGRVDAHAAAEVERTVSRFEDQVEQCRIALPQCPPELVKAMGDSAQRAVCEQLEHRNRALTDVADALVRDCESAAGAGDGTSGEGGAGVGTSREVGAGAGGSVGSAEGGAAAEQPVAAGHGAGESVAVEPAAGGSVAVEPTTVSPAMTDPQLLEELREQQAEQPEAPGAPPAGGIEDAPAAGAPGEQPAGHESAAPDSAATEPPPERPADPPAHDSKTPEPPPAGAGHPPAVELETSGALPQGVELSEAGAWSPDIWLAEGAEAPEGAPGGSPSGVTTDGSVEAAGAGQGDEAQRVMPANTGITLETTYEVGIERSGQW